MALHAVYCSAGTVNAFWASHLVTPLDCLLLYAYHNTKRWSSSRKYKRVVLVALFLSAAL